MARWRSRREASHLGTLQRDGALLVRGYDEQLYCGKTMMYLSHAHRVLVFAVVHLDAEGAEAGTDAGSHCCVVFSYAARKHDAVNLPSELDEKRTKILTDTLRKHLQGQLAVSITACSQLLDGSQI